MMLVCTVVFWGMQYKVSLYRSPAARASVPAAKLLSQDERACSVPGAYTVPTGGVQGRWAAGGLSVAAGSGFGDPARLPLAPAPADHPREPAAGGPAVSTSRGPPATA